MKLAVFDIGGTNIKCGSFQDNKIASIEKFATPKTFTGLKLQMHRFIDKHAFDGIAISAPGAVDKSSGTIKGISAVPYIHDRPIFKELQEEFSLPVAIENDANCAGICEVNIGAGKNFTNVAFIIIGTGIGGAIFINRKLYKGNHLFGGEFGLIQTSDGGTLSTRATIVKAASAYERQTQVDNIDGEKLFLLADQGDKLAQDLIDKVYSFLAVGLYNIEVAFDFDALIIGGGISAHKGFSSELSKRLYAQLVKNKVGEIMPEVKECQYHNNANLYGAAYNFISDYAIEVGNGNN